MKDYYLMIYPGFIISCIVIIYPDENFEIALELARISWFNSSILITILNP